MVAAVPSVADPKSIAVADSDIVGVVDEVPTPVRPTAVDPPVTLSAIVSVPLMVAGYDVCGCGAKPTVIVHDPPGLTPVGAGATDCR